MYGTFPNVSILFDGQKVQAGSTFDGWTDSSPYVKPIRDEEDFLPDVIFKKNERVPDWSIQLG